MIPRFLAAALMALGLAGTGAAQTLTVGAYPANPPWEYKTETGAFEGFEVDMVTEIAERMGRDLAISDMGFQALFAATASGRIDIAISTISITEERLHSQSFTQGYYDADLGLVTASDGGVAGLAEMQGKIVGTLAASTGEAWINAHMDEVGFSEVRTYPDQNSLLLDVGNGRVAGAINDILGFETQARQMQGIEVVERIPTGDKYGLMLQKNSPLLEEVNAQITAMKEDGTMAAIYEKWLGSPPPEGSSTVTVLEIP
ncbi:transporter substrate-binding domain-containing protein [Paracoccus sp. S-4012]|uniref:ABC transporter substrate-binding protein n=1 Tax=Paracoccus sp. S-4012 TaxID=2665648 RepID=UPI0012AF79F2|nr:ABC transporter substrate-binding protein [Paracoccus sp. S-4012]MRX51846.1 transporter substrate-binding domain-containing protein [Paracoccus sp. S-4012]